VQGSATHTGESMRRGLNRCCVYLRAAEMAARCFFGVMIWLMVASSLLAQDSGLAFRRAEHLRHGINLSHWYAQVLDPKGYTKEHFDSYDTEQDMALIKAMGFDHVRFTLNCEPMFRRGQADRIPPEYLAMVDAAVKMILEQGLAVIIDIHPESEFKTKLASDDAAVEQFEDFWRALAWHFSTLDRERAFLKC
jgi:endoglucanase